MSQPRLDFPIPRKKLTINQLTRQALLDDKKGSNEKKDNVIQEIAHFYLLADAKELKEKEVKQKSTFENVLGFLTEEKVVADKKEQKTL